MALGPPRILCAAIHSCNSLGWSFSASEVDSGVFLSDVCIRDDEQGRDISILYVVSIFLAAVAAL